MMEGIKRVTLQGHGQENTPTRQPKISQRVLLKSSGPYPLNNSSDKIIHMKKDICDKERRKTRKKDPIVNQSTRYARKLETFSSDLERMYCWICAG